MVTGQKHLSELIDDLKYWRSLELDFIIKLICCLWYNIGEHSYYIIRLVSLDFYENAPNRIFKRSKLETECFKSVY